VALKSPPAMVRLLKRSKARTVLLRPGPRGTHAGAGKPRTEFSSHWAMCAAAAPLALVNSPPATRWLKLGDAEAGVEGLEGVDA